MDVEHIAHLLGLVLKRLDRIEDRQERIMGDVSKLNAIDAQLTADVDALIAAIASIGASDQAAIDAATASLQALDQKVVAATPAPTTTPAP